MHPTTCVQWLATECNKTQTFAELSLIAVAELRKFKDGAEILCGPITTGGRGNVEENLQVFATTIHTLQQQGRSIFNQMPYEERIFYLTRCWKEQNPSVAAEYHTPILDGFYAPLFKTGIIRRGLFLPGWKSSRGARWERQQFFELGIEVQDLYEGE